MTSRSWLILSGRGKGNKEQEIISDIREYVLQKHLVHILFLTFKDESCSSGEAARKGGHPEIYDHYQKMLPGADLQLYVTLIVRSRSELLDNRIKELCDQASPDHPELYTSNIMRVPHVYSKNEVNARLERIITGGKNSVTFCPPGLPHKVIKVPVCVWWDMSGIIFYEMLEPGQVVNSDVYCDQLDRVKQELVRKGCDLVNNQCRILQHNNASAFTAKTTQEKIWQLGFEILPHQPNEANLLPSHYHLFKDLEKGTLREKLTSVEEVKIYVDKFLKDKPKKFFEDGIKELPSRWEKVFGNLSGLFVSKTPLTSECSSP